MADLNLLVLSGRIAQAPEIRQVSGGQSVMTFSMATDRYVGPDKPKETEWTKVKMWGKVVEALGPHLAKGDPVTVAGEKRTEKWQDKQGQNRETVILLAKTISAPRSRSRGPEGSDAPDAQWAGQAQEGGFTNDDLPY